MSETYPTIPGAKARDTSFAAADAMKARVPTLRQRVLSAYEEGRAMTADEAADAVGASILSVRPRVAELARLGLIRDSGERRKNASEHRAIVWTVKQA